MLDRDGDEDEGIDDEVVEERLNQATRRRRW